ncbi:MAG: protein kinase domain-containing protein [Bradymonadia bacterium]
MSSKDGLEPTRPVDPLDDTGDLSDIADHVEFQGSSGSVTELLGSVNGPAPRDTASGNGVPSNSVPSNRASGQNTSGDMASSHPDAKDRSTPQSPITPRPILPPRNERPASAEAPTRDRGGLADARTLKDTELPAELRKQLRTIPFTSGDVDRSQNRLPTIPESSGPAVDPLSTSPDQPMAPPRHTADPPLTPLPKRRSEPVRTQAPTLVDAKRSGRPKSPAPKGHSRRPVGTNPKSRVAAAARIDPQAVAKKHSWTPEIDDVVGDWRIDAEVGRGGMGRVYRAVHTVTEQVAALKMLMPHGQKDRSHRNRFINEAKVLAKLEHPNLVGMLGFFEHRDRLFIVMRFVQGRTLEDVLRDRGRMVADEAMAIFDQICDAVSHVHSHKILHRDIKPSNVILQDDGQVLVTDFGIARAVGDTSMTLSGMVVGTAEYVAPEQACGLSRDDLRSDVYALGILLYEMVTGHVPFSHPSPAEVLRQHVSAHPPPPRVVCPEVPEALDAALLTALSKAPEKRFHTPEAFKKAVHAALAQPNGPRGTRAPASAAPAPAPRTPAPRSTRISPEDEFARPTQSQPESAPPQKKGTPVWFAILFTGLLLGGGGFAAWWFLLR